VTGAVKSAEHILVKEHFGEDWLQISIIIHERSEFHRQHF
jgi:hypothetical protein